MRLEDSNVPEWTFKGLSDNGSVGLNQGLIPEGLSPSWDDAQKLALVQMILPVSKINYYTQRVPSQYARGTAAHGILVPAGNVLKRWLATMPSPLSFGVCKGRSRFRVHVLEKNG